MITPRDAAETPRREASIHQVFFSFSNNFSRSQSHRPSRGDVIMPPCDHCSRSRRKTSRLFATDIYELKVAALTTPSSTFSTPGPGKAVWRRHMPLVKSWLMRGKSCRRGSLARRWKSLCKPFDVCLRTSNVCYPATILTKRDIFVENEEQPFLVEQRFDFSFQDFARGRDCERRVWHVQLVWIQFEGPRHFENLQRNVFICSDILEAKFLLFEQLNRPPYLPT